MKQSKITGIVGTVVLHLLVLLLLFLLKLVRPEPQEEGGVPVMLGSAEVAQGDSDPYKMTEVDVMPQLETTVAEPEVVKAETEQPMITQTDEPSIQVEKEQPKEVKNESEESQGKKNKDTDSITKSKEKTEAEKRAEAERKAAETAAAKIAGAFGKGSKMGSKGDIAGEGLQGSVTGNSASGKGDGIGGHGTFDLNGRELGPEGLPVPVYNVQEEGRVVVTIVVDPAGRVISTSINKRTNTVNPVLRRAAEEAASKARFNRVDGVNNQSGTITYYFKLK